MVRLATRPDLVPSRPERYEQAEPGGGPDTKEQKVALNKRSRVITEGDARSANRAMLYPVGFTAADFGKPIVGIALGHSTMNPCNAGIGSLVEIGRASCRERVWIAVCDVDL